LHLLVRQSVMAAFAGFPHASLETGEGAPDYVVVGDIGAAWSYPLLNTVFNELMQGVTLVLALPGNRLPPEDAFPTRERHVCKAHRTPQCPRQVQPQAIPRAVH
jgi:hypothetical protein